MAGAVARGWGCRAEPSSGDGVTLSLLADAQPRVCPTREAEGVLQDRLAFTGIIAPHLQGLSAWASHPAPLSLKRGDPCKAQ